MHVSINEWLNKHDAKISDTISYDTENKSVCYSFSYANVIIDAFYFDDHLLDVFDYRTYTSFQNRIMQKGLPVYRFLIEENPTEVDAWLTGSVEFSSTYTYSRDRSLSVADASSLEHFFEQRFCEVYGCDAIKYLHREFPLPSRTKTSYSLDYVVQKLNGTMVAVEENGVSYHHPLLIGRTAYKRQIEKQNICSVLGIPLYRFTSLDCAYPALVDEQIKYIFGDSSTFRLAGLSLQRSYRLYDHQILALEEIQELRSTSASPHAVLQVFPTATGKSKIVEEDLIGYLSKNPKAKVLIVGPSLRIVEDWKQRMTQLFNNTSITIGTDIDSQIVIGTYHLLWSLSNRVESSYFSYLVFDEAHHAVAPVIRRCLQYFEPDFLIGMTATPERLDDKRLEEVFGTYRSKLDLQQAIEKQLIANIRAYR
ncbi:MAG: DEAD/DEAH box helicase, partial [Spirochaetia bacterium]|nr:DEAD/DEAH box helicase [Spirochaetia bacterium]